MIQGDGRGLSKMANANDLFNICIQKDVLKPDRLISVSFYTNILLLLINNHKFTVMTVILLTHMLKAI